MTRRYLVGWRTNAANQFEISFYQYAESLPEAIELLQAWHGFADEDLTFAKEHGETS